MNIALLIEYDGSGFCGFQSQGTQRTVQTTVEKALTVVADERVRITCAGRTDSGVHATYQVVNFNSDKDRSADAWVRGTNANLPKDVAVIECQEVEPAFHARFSAMWRRYLYLFYETQVVPAFDSSLVSCVVDELDVEAMGHAAGRFIGEKDFSSFRAANCDSKSPCRLITHLDVIRQGRIVAVDVVANAFLLRMVRNIAGTLLEVGLGKFDVRKTDELINARDRTIAPATAVPNGLYLIEVGYPTATFSEQTRFPMVLGPNAALHFNSSPKRPRERFEQMGSVDGLC